MASALMGQLTQRGLSRREVEVALKIFEGKTNQEAANDLFVVEKTIKFHLTNIYKKFDLKNRSGLIVEIHNMTSPGTSLPRPAQRQPKS